MPEMSYTELEFDTAAGRGCDRLVFMGDPGADQTWDPGGAADGPARSGSGRRRSAAGSGIAG